MDTKRPRQRPGPAPLFNPEQEQEIARRFQGGERLGTLAREFGSRRAVETSLKRSGVYEHRPMARALTPDQEHTLAERFVAGEHLVWLVREVGVARMLVVKSLQRSGVYEKRQKINPGRRAFTPEQDAEIAARFRSGESVLSLMRSYGVGRTAMENALDRRGITDRQDGRVRRWTDAEVDEVCALWASGRSMSAIARQFRVNAHTVRDLLGKAGITVEHRTGSLPGKDHPGWKGGRVKVSGGYVGVIVDPNDPIGTAMRRSRSYVLEHRLKMAHLLGRPLTAEENPHHVNGDRTDNTTDGPLDERFRSGNLELWARSQPAGQRVADQVDSAVTVLSKYRPDLLAGRTREDTPCDGGRWRR